MIHTCNRNATEPQAFLDLEYVGHVVVRREYHGVRDEAVLVSLDGSDHRCLRLCRLVVMNDTNTAKELPTMYQLKHSRWSHWDIPPC